MGQKQGGKVAEKDQTEAWGILAPLHSSFFSLL